MSASPIGPGADTRARLVEAAERLFAERGVDAVSLREINRESGARNAVAIQYHFTDRAGVLQAILDKHLPDVEARRHALLDQYEADHAGPGRPGDLRALTGALVRPLAAKLADGPGRDFLQIYADLLNRPRPAVDQAALDDPLNSFYRWRTLVDPHLPPAAAELHRRFTAVLYTATELGRRARSGPRNDDRLFVSYIVDVVASILSAEVSDETRRLAAEKARTRGRKT